MREKVKGKKKNSKLLVIVLVIMAVALLLIFLCGRPKKMEDSVGMEKDEHEVSEAVEEEKTETEVEVELEPKNVSAVVPIFMYHFILDDYGDYPDVENFLKPETLEEQLKYITDNGYQTIFTSELDKLYKYEKPVALTFDDVFVYFYDNAYPLFKKYKQKATLYIITEYINGENYLTDAQIKEMAESGYIEIESHTKTHNDLSSMSYDEQKEEITGSKERLEALTGKELTTICYPYGLYNNDTIEISKDAGYKFGLRMDGGIYNTDVTSDLYQIPRIYANRSMPLATFASYLSQAKVDVEY